jgi:hypothetical protein
MEDDDDKDNEFDPTFVGVAMQAALVAPLDATGDRP